MTKKEWKNGELVEVPEVEPTEVAPLKEAKHKKEKSEKAPKEFPAVNPPEGEEPKEGERSFHLNAD